MVLIAPSILSADFLRLGEELKAIKNAQADIIHIDVMDGHFVPNLTMGPPIIKAIKQQTDLPLDVHLMIKHPERFIDTYIDAGADRLTIHAESCLNLMRTVKAIKDQKVLAGVSLSPATHEHALAYVLKELDIVLIMTVEPGFSGQKFLSGMLKKIENVKAMIDREKAHSIIAVDGGIDDQTISACHKAGASCFIAGSYIFRQKDYKQAIKSLRTAAL